MSYLVSAGLKPWSFGGEQESGYRVVKETTHNSIGMDEGLKIAYTHLDEEKSYVFGLKAYFIQQLKEHLADVNFNGACEDTSNIRIRW